MMNNFDKYVALKKKFPQKWKIQPLSTHPHADGIQCNPKTK